VATGGKATGGASTGGRSTGGTGTGGSSTCTGHTGFWVDGRYLRDRCCEKVILRGVSEMVVWSSSQDGTPYFAEIAKTGANVVRIVWETAGSPSKLDAAINNAIANKLIPMPELHDATGDLSKLGTCVNYWIRSDVVSVIQKYQDKLLVNIANEVGNGSVAQSSFTSSYQDAITRMRNAGIHVPLVIDGTSWGQNIDMLQAAGPGLITYDPDHNLLFSVHMWWNDPNGTRVTTELNESVNKNLPLIVGEFAQHAVTGCSSSPFAYKTLLSLSASLEIGWLAWSWGGVKNSDCASDGPFDMTTNGTYNGLTGWGLEVARTDSYSIQNTAVRPRYMTAGSCS
jgi:mannan endo-1,4-beta-mannosidase